MSFLTVVFSLGVLLLFPSQPLWAARDDLVFSAELDKTQYTVDEPVNVAFVLSNRGQKPVYVNKRFFFNSEEVSKSEREVYVILTAPSGQKLSFKFLGETGYPKSDYFQLLEPGAQVKSEYPRNLKGNFELEETGAYQLVAVYQNVFGNELGLEAATAKFTSQPVRFEIK